MKFMAGRLCVLAVAGLLSAGSLIGQDSPLPEVAEIDTLKLQSPIRSWGRLGGMAVDRLGFLYISNFGESVWRITPDGAVTKLADGLYGASGMAIASDGALLQSNFFDNTVRRIARDGEMTTVAKGLSGPVGIAVVPDGTYYVVNCSGNSVSKVTPGGEVSTLVSSDLFACPNGIVAKEDGLYVVSFSNNNMVKVSYQGQASLFTTIGEAEGRAAGHAHLALAGGHFFVTSVKTSSLWRVAEDGSVTRILGPSQPENVDGPPDQARISNPNAIVSAGRRGPLFLNTIVPGQWGTTAPTELFIRRVRIKFEE